MMSSALMKSSSNSSQIKSKAGVMKLGNRDVTLGVHLVEMTDSSELYRSGDYAAVHARLLSDGFVLIRGVVAEAAAIRARRTLLDHLNSKKAIRLESREGEKELSCYDGEIAAVNAGKSLTRLLPGWTVDAINGYVIGNSESVDDAAQDSWHRLAQSDAVRGVYNGSDLHTMFSNVLVEGDRAASTAAGVSKQIAMQPDCTWLRMKGAGEVTAEHVDYYYFKKATTMLSDNWTAAAAAADSNTLRPSAGDCCELCSKDCDPELLLICDLCERYHHTYCVNSKLKLNDIAEGEWHCSACADSVFPYYTCWVALGDVQATGGSLCMLPQSHTLSGFATPSRVDLLPGGYSKAVEAAAVWQTPSAMRPGDAILFNLKTIHGATKNAGTKFRLSLDTRLAVITVKNSAAAAAAAAEKAATAKTATAAVTAQRVAASDKKKQIGVGASGSFDAAAAKRRDSAVAAAVVADDSSAKKKRSLAAYVEPARAYVRDGTLNSFSRRKIAHS